MRASLQTFFTQLQRDRDHTQARERHQAQRRCTWPHMGIGLHAKSNEPNHFLSCPLKKASATPAFRSSNRVWRPVNSNFQESSTSSKANRRVSLEVGESSKSKEKEIMDLSKTARREEAIFKSKNNFAALEGMMEEEADEGEMDLVVLEQVARGGVVQDEGSRAQVLAVGVPVVRLEELYEKSVAISSFQGGVPMSSNRAEGLEVVAAEAFLGEVLLQSSERRVNLLSSSSRDAMQPHGKMHGGILVEGGSGLFIPKPLGPAGLLGPEDESFCEKTIERSSAMQVEPSFLLVEEVSLLESSPRCKTMGAGSSSGLGLESEKDTISPEIPCLKNGEFGFSKVGCAPSSMLLANHEELDGEEEWDYDRELEKSERA